MFVINQLEAAFNAFANFMWSTPLVVLLVGGGIGLMLYSRFRPYYHLGHAGFTLILRTHLKRSIMAVEECHATEKKILTRI